MTASAFSSRTLTASAVVVVVSLFTAGTLVVRDVDPDAQTVAVYEGDATTPRAVYRRGQTAEAGPAVPMWSMPVDEVFA